MSRDIITNVGLVRESRIAGMKLTTCLGIIILGAFVCYSLADVTLQFDISKPTTPFPHFWEQCVGSGHALLVIFNFF